MEEVESAIIRLERDYEDLFANDCCWNDCPEYWYELCDKMLKEFREKWPYLQIDQLKEKFGTLRLYCSEREDQDFPLGVSWSDFDVWLRPYENEARELYRNYRSSK